MSLLNYITVILLFETSYADKNNVPVLMLDNDQIMYHVQIDPNPFDRITATVFADIVHDSIRRSDCIVLFIEDALSTEDVSSKDKYGTPFANLRAGLADNKVKYLPAVTEPYKLLNQILQPQHYNVFYLRTHTKLHFGDNLKYIYVFFQDELNESRSQILRRHDSIIRNVMFTVRQLKSGPIVAFYTGKLNPVVVHKLQYSSASARAKENPNPGVVIYSGEACFKFSGVFIVTKDRRVVIKESESVVETVAEDGNTMTTEIRLKEYDTYAMQFNFTFDNETWTIDTVAIVETDEIVGHKKMGVGAGKNFSYICGEPIIIVNTRDSSTLTISQYQIQPKDHGLGEYPPADAKCFDEPVNCGPYFSSTILAALMCTVMFFAIMMHGILGLMDVNANDRYEDPNSTPLQHGG